MVTLWITLIPTPPKKKKKKKKPKLQQTKTTKWKSTRNNYNETHFKLH